MGSYYQTKLRPRLKQATSALGIKRSRARLPKKLPADFDEQTLRILAAVYEFTMTGPERIEACICAARYVARNAIPGDVVECGVWRGGSSMAIAMTLQELGDETRDLYLYDTFEGMSAPTEHDVAVDGERAAEKFDERRLTEDSSQWCRATIDDVQQNLLSTQYPRARLHFVQGKVEDTIPATMPAGDIAILRLDTDWYESTKHELEHLYPRLVSGGVLIIDDYGHWRGARQAVDEYIEANGLKLLLSRVDYTARMAVKP